MAILGEPKILGYNNRYNQGKTAFNKKWPEVCFPNKLGFTVAILLLSLALLVFCFITTNPTEEFVHL